MRSVRIHTNIRFDDHNHDHERLLEPPLGQYGVAWGGWEEGERRQADVKAFDSNKSNDNNGNFECLWFPL